MYRFASFFKTAALCAAVYILPGTAGAEAPTNYYSSCEGKSGQALLKQLESVISSHTNVGYDGLWTVYKDSDVRPDDGSLWDMYSTKHWPRNFTKCGNYSRVGDCVNREHSFPKSWWGGSKNEMYSDAFHLVPTDGKVNNQRSSYPYGECSGGSYLASNGNVKPLGRLGSSTFPGYSGTVFEPDDEYKGDFARSYFYMATCYNSRLSSTTKGDMMAGNSYPFYKSWAVNLLLKWHRQDPVSQKEIDRNEAVYKHQHNRNPYIDHPELAEHIWGNKTSEGWHAGAASAPEITLPVSGSTIDLGAVAVNFDKTLTICVKGSGLTDAATVTVSGTGLSVSRTSIPAAEINSTAGASLTLTLRAASAGKVSGSLSIASGDASTSINITASAVNGLPAEVKYISDRSATVTWVYIGNDNAAGKYTLNLREKATSAAVSGYPILVNAKAETYTCLDLEPETAYEFWIESEDMQSARIPFTTAAAMPSVQLLYEDELWIEATPGEPSEAYEILVEADNITSDITLSVDAPFELSSDKSNWSRTLIIDPEEDRFYLRTGATSDGRYSTAITVTSGTYFNDGFEANANVSAIVAFIEDFEPVDNDANTYSGHEYTGSASVWYLYDAGYLNQLAKPNSGKQCVRMGNKATSYIEMRSDKTRGAGTVSLYARKWSASEANATFKVEYSTDGGQSWEAAPGSATVSSETYSQYSFEVNRPGNVRVRVAQTAGKRFFIDDVAISDYVAAGIDGVESDYHAWDSFCRGGRLIIESDRDLKDVVVCGVDGIIYYKGNIKCSETELSLADGLYIVVSGDFTRRVMVK